MSLASSNSRIDYRGNGSTTAFPVLFRFLSNEHLAVWLFNATTGLQELQVLTSDYTLTGANQPSGGTLTMVVAPAADETLTIIRDVPIDQLLNFRENETLSANKLEFAVDKITMILQQLDERVRRGILLKVTTPVDADLDIFPEAGGFTSVFAARLDEENEEGSFDFVEQVPIASGAWANRASGITGVAWPLPNCAVGWEDDLPVYVLIYVHIDADNVTRYVFNAPPACDLQP